jgi:hypothetical protein
MATYEETAGSATKATRKESANEPLPSSDDAGYAQAIAGGTVSTPIGEDPKIKKNLLPDEEATLPSATNYGDAESSESSGPRVNMNLTPE